MMHPDLVDKGPSPRERESQQPPSDLGAGEGSIPARAGEPSSRLTSCHTCGVHPRASGGAPQYQVLEAKQQGPSPRERGSRPAGERAAAHMGSIPARAGEPSSASRCRASMRVHPRASGGAPQYQVLEAKQQQGPSPRERGGRRRVSRRRGSAWTPCRFRRKPATWSEVMSAIVPI
jgi:hypothetical protein